MKRKSLSAEPEKVHRLTLAELAAHDDACSDAMVDNAYFKSQIRKNKTKYFPLRIKEDEIPQILLQKVIVQKDPAAAEKALLQVPGLKRYRASLRSKAEQENFLRHIRKYINMYQTDCPWEVSTTNRYTITTYEAAVTARQRVKQGQVIKYLVGTLVPLTAEESADLDHTNRNFSIVVSSRKKNSSIFLGPARFANHDCDANGRLVTRGSDSMEVIAMKNIEIGDEITVSYGDDYFGPGNIDCLCHTCERLMRNGWAAARDLSESPEESLASPQASSPAPSLTKRKRDSGQSLRESMSLQPNKKLKAKPSPSKLQQSWTPTSSATPDITEIAPPVTGIENVPPADGTPILEEDLALSPPHSPEHEILPATDDATQADGDQKSVDQRPGMVTRRQSSGNMRLKKDLKADKMTARLLGSLSTHKQYPLSPVSSSASLGESATGSSFAQSDIASDKVTIKVEIVEANKLETDTIVVSSHNRRHGSTYPMVDDERQQPTALSTLITTEITKTAPLLTTDTSSIVPSIEPPVVTTTTTTTSAHLTVKPLSDRIRIPGDYLLTRKLLAQPHDRWVQCHNERCQCFFIQPNGYQTRRECPRCERHSMLYGFSWPKMDPDPRKILERSPRGKKNKVKTEHSAYRRAGKCGKGTWYEGGGDEEERVMDHRTVHRFVLPEDEKAITKRGLLKQAENARLSGLDVDLSDGTGVGRRRTESLGLGGTDSTGDRSLTPDGESRRRSNRFVTRVGLYADA